MLCVKYAGVGIIFVGGMMENICLKCTKTYADKCCFSFFFLPSTELHVSCVKQCCVFVPQHCFCLVSLIPLTHTQLHTPSVDDCQLKCWWQIWTPFPLSMIRQRFIQTAFIKEHYGLLRDINRRCLHNAVWTVKIICNANNSLGFSVNGCSSQTLHSVFQTYQHAVQMVLQGIMSIVNCEMLKKLCFCDLLNEES